jgi:hypothetical protein
MGSDLKPFSLQRSDMFIAKRSLKQLRSLRTEIFVRNLNQEPNDIAILRSAETGDVKTINISLRWRNPMAKVLSTKFSKFNVQSF